MKQSVDLNYFSYEYWFF